MHKSVLYLICTCEQPSAPGSYRPPGKAGGYPRKKKATCLQSFKCSFSAGTLGDGGGERWTKTDGRRRDTSSVYMLRVHPASEKGAGEAAFSLETRVAAAARGRGWGSPRAPPASMGSHSEAGGLGAPADPAAPRPRDSAARGTAPGCAPAAPWMLLQHLAGSGAPPKKHPDTPRPLGPGRAPLWAPGPPRSPRRPAALGLGLWRRRRRRLLHGG